jgi:hypothetical protein
MWGKDFKIFPQNFLELGPHGTSVQKIERVMLVKYGRDCKDELRIYGQKMDLFL